MENFTDKRKGVFVQFGEHISVRPPFVTQIVLIVFIFIPSFPFTQPDYQSEIDSLSIIVQTSLEVRDQLHAQSAIVRRLSLLNPVKSLEYVPLAEELMRENVDISVSLFASVSVAQAYYVNGNLIKARETLLQLAPRLSEASDHKDKIYANTLLAFSYEHEDLEKCMEYFDHALLIARGASDTALMGATNSNIGNIYSNRSLTEEAKKYFSQAIHFLRVKGNKLHLATALNNLFLLEDDDEKAFSYIKEAQEIYLERGYLERSAELEISMAQRYYHDANYGMARSHYRSYLKAMHNFEKPQKYYEALIPLGLSFIELNEADSALLVLSMAQKYYIENPEIRTKDEHYLHEGMMKALAAKNRFKEAYDHALRRIQIFDSLEYSKNAEFTSEFNIKYETEKKERQIAEQQLLIEREQNKRNKILLLGISLLSLIGLASFWFFNMTKRKRREAQHALDLQTQEAESLKVLDATKSRWFENISHDIRTPLTLISAPIKDLMKLSPSAAAQNLLTIADRNSQHLLQLTNEMLELSRLENDAIPVRPSTRPAFDEFQKMINAFDSFASERAIDLSYDIHFEKSTFLSLDYDKYEKIFNNIFKNAIQYSPVNSMVTAHIKLHNENLVTTISDEGSGISKEQVNSLFDKYYRAESEKIEGSGLGLAIVKELIVLLKGDIEVKSEVGKGSVFTFKIPIEIKHEESIELQEEFKEDTEDMNSSDYVPVGQHTILIVEDNQEMSHYLSDVLSVEYIVATANNGLSALQKLDERPFDLIISDIMMPGMDGFTFKKQVNNLSRHKSVPFVFLSAKSLDSDKMRGLRLGVDDYITKPFVTDELKVRIQNILTRKSVREQCGQQEDVKSIDEQSLVDRARDIVLDEMRHVNFGVEQLAERLHYSRRQLNRIFKKETGMTTVQFILEIRMQQARKLLLSHEYYSVKEVQHEIGIHSKSYFSRKYSERFGNSPKTYLSGN